MRTGIGLRQGSVNEISESNVSVKIRTKSKILNFFLNLADYYLDFDIHMWQLLCNLLKITAIFVAYTLSCLPAQQFFLL
jgi:hypothetical protein